MTLSDLISQRVDKNKDLLIRNITVEPRFVRISRLVDDQWSFIRLLRPVGNG